MTDLPLLGARPLPEVFCWTKMGAEAGQTVETILRRKELERQAGAGTFSWGIGNSVGPALLHARQALGLLEVEAIFTAMKSAPKTIDEAPDGVAIWTGYLGDRGESLPLPPHMLITSRQHAPSGAEKDSHFALVCRSDSPPARTAPRNFRTRGFRSQLG